ncbi:MAG: HEAT repeat domain-containing protein [bacterium]
MTDSLSTVVFLFTLWLPVWHQQPLTEADLRPMPYPLVLPATGVALVRTGFDLGDEEWRERLAVQLGRTQDPQAFQLLAAQLSREPQPLQQATILQQLGHAAVLPKATVASLPRYLASPDPTVRAAALALVPATAKTAPPEALLAGTRDPEAQVRAAAWRRLCRQAGAPTAAFLRQALATSEAPDRTVAVVCAMGSPDAAALAPQLKAAAKDADPGVRTALAGALPMAPGTLAAALIPVLAQDAHPTVRATTAEALATVTARAGLEPVVIQLTDDSDPEVRRLAVIALAHFPSPASRTAALARLGDSTSLTRQAAEDTLVMLNQAKVPTVPAILPGLNDPNPAIRAHAVRVLGRIGWPQPGAADGVAVLALLSARLQQEKDPEALAAVAFCLGRLEMRQSAPAIARLARLSSPEVRLETATALARLKDATTYPTLEKLTLDTDAAVRQAAIGGIGHSGDPLLAPALVQVLEAVSATAGAGTATATDRAAAAWTAGHLRQVDDALVKRLITHSTTPVVPTMMGPVFDADIVLSNAIFALAKIAHANPALKPQVQPVLRFLQTKPESAAGMGQMRFLPSPEVRETARQAAALLDHRPLASERRPTQELSLPCRPAASSP